MRLKNLKLFKAKRLKVRGIEYFEVTFTELYQIIIGTNGSGKSYILSESSPLPGIPANFEDGGYKEATFEHDGMEIVCRSDFDKQGSRHSMCVDGVYVNENGTLSMQRELVEKYFRNLNQEMFNVLIGKKFWRFTDMDTLKRRKLLMMMSGIDLDFAMEVFQALKNKTRDFNGHVKRLNQKLALESDVLIPDDEVSQMEVKLTKLQGEFNEALRLLKEDVPKLKQIEEMFKYKMNELHELNNVLDKIMEKTTVNLNIPGVTDGTSFAAYIAERVGDLKSTEERLTKLYQDKDKISGELERLKVLGESGLEEYESMISFFDKEIEAIDVKMDNSRFNIQVDQSVRALRDPKFYGIVLDCLRNMFDNSEGIITLERTNDYRNQEHNCVLRINELKDKLKRLQHRMEHAKEVDHVDCPDCGSNFKPGFKDDFDAKADQAIITFNKELKQQEVLLEEARDYLSKVALQIKGFNNLETIQRHYSGHWQFWEELGNYGLETNNPLVACSIVNEYEEYCNLMCHKLDVMSSRFAKQNIYDQVKQLDLKDVEHTKNFNKNLDVEIEDTIVKIRQLKSEIKTLGGFMENLNETEATLYLCDGLVADIEELFLLEDDAACNDYLESILIMLKGEIDTLERSVSTIRIQKAIVLDLQKSVSEAKFEYDLHKVMAEELSPTDGLIADVLREFIESLTDNWSNLINSVWSYELRVLPCISKKDGLDYKFPIRVFGSDLPIPDVSEGSDAQVDIVDITFRLMFMSLMGLFDFPLYLDEAISRMDELHRVEMIRIIESMVESNQCSQMFFISHFAAQHGSFPNPEILVMDASNIISLPTLYNQHAILK